MHPWRKVRGLSILAAAVLACGGSPGGLWPTPPGSGPVINFDLLKKPFPDIPFPNDIATRLDRDSPTGRRVNVSIVAPTILEHDVRKEFNLLDGFGTFAPITVSFSKPIDPLDIQKRHADDDFSNDAVYVVDLKTGEPVMLDLGRGNFPVVVQNNDKYFWGDPNAEVSNLLFPPDNTVDPTKPAYGVTEDSSSLPTKAPPGEGGNDQYRDLLTFYERATNTLIIRPVVPLHQETTYAVVLTNRIHGVDGEPIRSPFPYENHVDQTAALKPLVSELGKGQLSGLTSKDVAFAWTFTTESVTRDLEAIRQGLYGQGKLGWIGKEYSDQLEPVTYVDRNGNGQPVQHPVHPLWDSKAARRKGIKNLYIVRMNDFIDAFNELTQQAFGLGPGLQKDAIMQSYKFVDYFVIGSFKSPDFLDDPTKPTFDAVFRVNPDEGTARIWTRPKDWEQIQDAALAAAYNDPTSPDTARAKEQENRAIRDRVWFMLAVPKAINGHEPPFPIAIYGHGYTSSRAEMLGFAGNLAKFGIATVAIDSYGHGLDVSQTDKAAIEGILNSYGFGPLMEAILEGRARDLNNDLVDDSGGDFWVADTFHTRDIVRQSIIDWMQLIRVFHAFGTYSMPLPGGGKMLAGDFNEDGTIDVGGPATIDGKRNPGHDVFVWGQSLGGILSGILPAIEPTVVAAAPTSGGGGLSDVAIRSEQGGVIQAVFLELFGPFLDGRWDGTKHQLDLWYDIQNVNQEAQFPISDPDGVDIKQGDTIKLINLDTDGGQPQLVSTAVAGDNGEFRLQIGADDASFYDGSPVDSAPEHLGACDPETAKTSKALGMIHPADCLQLVIQRQGQPARVIDTFGRDIVFQERHIPQGSPLIALARGFGMQRDTPKFRQFMTMAQTILEPADPVNYAPHYFKDLLPARKGNPAAVLVVGTTGDLNVPVNVSYADARAAGILPYIYDPQRDAAWGMSPNDVLIQSKAMEVLEKLMYFTPVANHMDDPTAPVDPANQNLVDLVECAKADDCRQEVLADPGLYSWDPTQQKFLDVGNTLGNGRIVVGHPDAADPSIIDGVPRLKHSLRDVVEQSYPGTDADGNPATRHSALIMPYLQQTGQHGFDLPNPEDPFDVDLYMINMIGRFFETRGTDLRYDICLNRDGWSERWFNDVDGQIEANPAAQRVPACSFIPEYPDKY